MCPDRLHELETVVATQADRIRHLESLQYIGVSSVFRGGQMRNTADFAEGSATGGLVESITNLAGSDGWLYVAPHNHPINANYMVPANAHLVIPKGVTITIANGVTLTINAPPQIGLYQIFVLVGTGTVVFAAGTVAGVCPEWFGATSTAGIQEAIASLP